MKLQNKFCLPVFFSFLLMLMGSNLLFASDPIALSVNNQIDEETTLLFKVCTDRSGSKWGKLSVDLPAFSAQPKTGSCAIESTKLSRIELTLFFNEDPHRTALYYAEDINFVPLKELRISLSHSGINVDVIYNLPPVWES